MLTNADYKIVPDQWVEGQSVGPRRAKPMQLAWLAQITLLTIDAGSETTDLVVTVTDVRTGQVYTTTATGSATEATLLANALAAIRASEIDKVFSVTGEVDTDVLITFTARHGNREYTIAATGGTAVADPVATEVQAAGGTGIEFGRMVQRGAADGEFLALTAATTLQQLAGLLERTDANHFHLVENDLSSSVDVCEVGQHLPIIWDGLMAVRVEEAVTPASTPYVRRALTSGAGRLGGFRATPAGSTQVSTITAVANHGHYVVEYGYLGEDYSFAYTPTDVTTSTDDAIDGLEDAAAENAPTGVTVSAASAAATMTLTAAAGTAFDYVRNAGFALDTEAASTTVSTAAADVDTLDISSIASFESSAGADGYALLRIWKQ